MGMLARTLPSQSMEFSQNQLRNSGSIQWGTFEASTNKGIRNLSGRRMLLTGFQMLGDCVTVSGTVNWDSYVYRGAAGPTEEVFSTSTALSVAYFTLQDVDVNTSGKEIVAPNGRFWIYSEVDGTCTISQPTAIVWYRLL